MRLVRYPEKLRDAKMATETRICPNCGKENPADSLYCMVCGTKLEAAINHSSPENPNADTVYYLPPQSRSPLKRFLDFLTEHIVPAFLLLLVLLFINQFPLQWVKNIGWTDKTNLRIPMGTSALSIDSNGHLWTIN